MHIWAVWADCQMVSEPCSSRPKGMWACKAQQGKVVSTSSRDESADDDEAIQLHLRRPEE